MKLRAACLRVLAVSGLGVAAVMAGVPGGPAARAAMTMPAPSITVADGNSVIAATTVSGNSVNIAAEGPNDSLGFYWALNGSPTWNLETIEEITTSGAAMTTYPGGVHVVNSDEFSIVVDMANPNGTTTWNQGQPSFEQTVTAAPAVTMNKGSENVAYIDVEGDLYFSWQDSSYQFHIEEVDSSELLT